MAVSLWRLKDSSSSKATERESVRSAPGRTGSDYADALAPRGGRRSGWRTSGQRRRSSPRRVRQVRANFIAPHQPTRLFTELASWVDPESSKGPSSLGSPPSGSPSGQGKVGRTPHCRDQRLCAARFGCSSRPDQRRGRDADDRRRDAEAFSSDIDMSAPCARRHPARRCIHP